MVLLFFMNDVKEERFQQQKQELFTSITSNTNDKEIYEIYVFGKEGSIPSDFDQQVTEIHIKYDPSIKNVTTIPYSDTSDIPYSKNFDLERYPTILVFSSEGIINRSYSPNELEYFLSSSLE